MKKSVSSRDDIKPHEPFDEAALKALQIKFGATVRGLRKKLAINQEILADRCGFGPSGRTYLADIERGARNLTLRNIARIAHGLDISIAQLFSEELAPAPQPPPTK